MRNAIAAVLILLCLFMIGCSSINQLTQQNDADKKAVALENYKLLEQKLIEDYLAQANLDQIQQEEDEVVIYNVRDELEFRGKAYTTDARLWVLKGDFLIDLNNIQIYRINK
jgi:hypothetical protein